MKLKNGILIIICLFFCYFSVCGAHHYSSIKDRSENWLTKTNVSASLEAGNNSRGRINDRRNNSSGRINDRRPTTDPEVVPITDALPVVCLLAAIYSVFVLNRKVWEETKSVRND
jgi:hypothetical protein